MLSHVVAAAAPPALHAYWVLATSAALIAALPMQGMQGFRHAVQLSAARGKLWDDRPPISLGSLTDAAVPQSWFAHFYVLGAACNAACGACLLAHMSQLSSANTHQVGTVMQLACLLALAALQFHLLRRWFETVAIMVYPAQARMHVIAYIFGLSYYGVLSLSLLPSADLVAILQHLPRRATFEPRHLVTYLKNQQWQQQMQPLVALGIIIFAAGNVLQNQSHRILAALTPASRAASIKTAESYRIPNGGAFEWVSCPHYLGEIVIYTGLVLMLRGRDLNAWLILAWVVCNLVLAAGATHKWYKRKFEGFPMSRRALVPFVY